MTVTVRLADLEDATLLAGLAAATFPLACPPGTAEADIRAFIDDVLSVDRFRHSLADEDRFLFIAFVDGEAVGYTMVEVLPPLDEDVAEAVTHWPTCELNKCYVLPGYHGMGLASSLMTATTTEAYRRGARGMWVGVNTANGRALGFYAKHGFVEIGEKTFLVGTDLFEDLVLEVALTEPGPAVAR